MLPSVLPDLLSTRWVPLQQLWQIRVLGSNEVDILIFLSYSSLVKTAWLLLSPSMQREPKLVVLMVSPVPRILGAMAAFLIFLICVARALIPSPSWGLPLAVVVEAERTEAADL